MNILVFQHEAVEPPGSFAEFWAAAGHDWTVVHLYDGAPIPVLEPFDLLVVLGGPMDVWQGDQYPWLADEVRAIRHWVRDLDRPYLGICLGHQLLAVALGGTVGQMEVGELALCAADVTDPGRADGLFGTASRLEVFHWHHAEVTRLPEGAEVLASSALCPVQAMRVGRAYGVQFHAEVGPTTLSDWCGLEDCVAALQDAFGPEGVALTQARLAAALPQIRAVAQGINARMMALCAGGAGQTASASSGSGGVS